MGCGKSKHAVETANTVVKSTNSDGTKETCTAKIVTEKGDSSVIQKEVETKSVFVEDTKKETVTTKIDNSGLTKTDSVPSILTENIEMAAEVFKEGEKVKDSNPTDVGQTNIDNGAPTSTENVGKATEVVKKDGKVKELSPTAASDANTDNVISTPSKDDVTTEVVKENEEKIEPTLRADNKTKTVKMPPTEDGETKESKLTKDNKTKTEFMTPTLSEDVVGPFEVVKEDEEVRDSKEENIKISDEKLVKTISDSSNTKDDNFKVEEQTVVAPAVESTKLETKKEEDVEVTEADIANAKTSPITEPEKVPIAIEANVAETYKKEPQTV